MADTDQAKETLKQEKEPEVFASAYQSLFADFSKISSGINYISQFDPAFKTLPPTVDKNWQDLGLKSDPGETSHNKNSISEATPELTLSKLLRESEVLGGGLAESILYGMADLPHKLPELTAAFSVGLALHVIRKQGVLGWGVATGLTAVFASKFVVDQVEQKEKWWEFASAIKDTWGSNQHTWNNINTVSGTAGKTVFDTAAFATAGYLGYTNKTEIVGLLAQGLGSVARIPAISSILPAIKPGVAPGADLGTATEIAQAFKTFHGWKWPAGYEIITYPGVAKLCNEYSPCHEGRGAN